MSEVPVKKLFARIAERYGEEASKELHELYLEDLREYQMQQRQKVKEEREQGRTVKLPKRRR